MSDWIHNDDPLECGVRLPRKVVSAFKKQTVTAEWLRGGSLRSIAKRHGVSHDTVMRWTRGMSRRPIMEAAQ